MFAQTFLALGLLGKFRRDKVPAHEMHHFTPWATSTEPQQGLLETLGSYHPLPYQIIIIVISSFWLKLDVGNGSPRC